MESKGLWVDGCFFLVSFGAIVVVEVWLVVTKVGLWCSVLWGRGFGSSGGGLHLLTFTCLFNTELSSTLRREVHVDISLFTPQMNLAVHSNYLCRMMNIQQERLKFVRCWGEVRFVKPCFSGVSFYSSLRPIAMGCLHVCLSKPLQISCEIL